MTSDGATARAIVRGFALASAIVGSIALATAPAAAQVTTGDTVARRSQPPKRQRPDSVQPRIGRDAPSPTLEIGDQLTYDRDAMFSTGALTLADLLDRIPAITTFRTGWLPAPQTAGYAGDFSRVRVFFDGIEMDDLEGRNGAAPDFHNVPIWALQSLTLVRSANELRVDLRTWEYNTTTPYTRVDVLTGDLNTNLYRAFYAKRYYNGAGLQIAGQQYGVRDERNGGGGDQFSIFGRYGIARGAFSLDATAFRTNGSRTTTSRFGSGQLLPGYRAASTLAYLRMAVGKEGSGPFVQLVASTQTLREASSHIDSASAALNGFPGDTVDTLASAAQYVATAGFDAYGGRLRLIERYRRRLGRGFNSPSATFDLSQKYLSLSGMVERDEYSGLERGEAGARFVPLPFIAVAGYVGTRNTFGIPAPNHVVEPTSRSATLTGGLRLLPWGLWATGGVITRDTSLLVPPSVFDSAFTARGVGRQNGVIFGLSGPLFYGLSISAAGTRWNSQYAYTPQQQAHAELRYYTEWLSRFPNGNFSFLIQPGFDFRSRVTFPETVTDREVGTSRIFSALVELRILRGVLTYQRRNLSDIVYEQVPGYIRPRALNVYGVRWYFYN